MKNFTLMNYVSPEEEYSIFKGVPMSELNNLEVQKFLSKHQYRIRYRGPRRKNENGTVSWIGQSVCLKADATTFAIYYK
jgi:hypothetical protein